METEDYQNTLGIKIKGTVVDAKTLMYLKKETKSSLNEIKERIANDEYIFLCDDSDTEGLHKINVMKKKLRELGVETLLYEDDEQEESYLFDNLEQLHKEIEKECELYPD